MTLQKFQKGLHTVYRLESGNEGIKTLIFGAVHGNEPCGPVGIERFVRNLNTPIKNGMVTFIPVCNPKAYENNERFYNSDLNRGFGNNPPSDSYEQDLVASLKEHIDMHDVLLDIHSYQRETIPFILNDKESTVNENWVKSLHTNIVVKGWDALYPNGGDTNAYAHKRGKHALTVECGQHTSDDAPHIAEKLIGETLAHFGVIDAPVKNYKAKQEYIMKELVKKPSEGAIFTRDWQNFDSISPNTPIYIDGQNEYLWEEDKGFMFMPKPLADKGKEWFYIIEHR